ncbi:MAG: BlaI/MecI/CopY family transcriptional regulator [Lachnospiraceae bacterium]|nr:BlaI/MecI/CopY family transcriptional regulator [Lachnospiraceae bacterium]MBR4058470.1 BlaI/MecI/CopY family transcriptional regulator [Lachnospiraceae bacterium]
MKNKYSMSDAERDVMEVLWTFPEGVNQSILLEAVNATGKDWKRQTLNTLVTRLMEKGLVNRENRHVCAVMDKQVYSNLQVEEVVREVYDGKLSNLVLAFAKDKKLTKEDAKELEKLLEAYETE